MGTYTLRSEFTSLLRPTDEAITLKSYSPEEIVQRIRNQIINEFSKSADESSSEEEISKSDAETKCANGTTKYSRARYVAITKCNCSIACTTYLVNHTKLLSSYRLVTYVARAEVIMLIIICIILFRISVIFLHFAPNSMYYS